jgi:hypothetical protein
MTFSHSRYNPQIKLSPEEMLDISQEINREFAPDFSIKKPEPSSQPKFSSEETKLSPEELKLPPEKIKLSPEEMLDISEEIRLNFAPKASDNTQELVLLPVDPDHLYAYWNLGDDKLNTRPKNDSGDQLTLRIYSEANKNTEVTKTKPWFDVAIDSTKAQQSVFLSMRDHETAYRATIGKRSPDNSLAPVAYSNITQVPLGKTMLNQMRESQIVFKPMPQQPITSSREIVIYTNNSASGQGNN